MHGVCLNRQCTLMGAGQRSRIRERVSIMGGKAIPLTNIRYAVAAPPVMSASTDGAPQVVSTGHRMSHGATVSRRRAISRTTASLPNCATICIPTGRPSGCGARGMLSPG